MNTTKEVDGLRYSKFDHFVCVWNASTFTIKTEYECLPMMVDSRREVYNNPGGRATKKQSTHEFKIFHN